MAQGFWIQATSEDARKSRRLHYIVQGRKKGSWLEKKKIMHACQRKQKEDPSRRRRFQNVLSASRYKMLEHSQFFSERESIRYGRAQTERSWSQEGIGVVEGHRRRNCRLEQATLNGQEGIASNPYFENHQAQDLSNPGSKQNDQ